SMPSVISTLLAARLSDDSVAFARVMHIQDICLPPCLPTPRLGGTQASVGPPILLRSIGWAKCTYPEYNSIVGSLSVPPVLCYMSKLAPVTGLADASIVSTSVARRSRLHVHSCRLWWFEEGRLCREAGRRSLQQGHGRNGRGALRCGGQDL